MKSQAFIDIEVSLALCLLFALFLSGVYIRFYIPASASSNGIASDINSTGKLVSGFIGQQH
ncbi:MAG: hypothetical protein QXW10_04200 [Candidatus Micrarchaeaceae archaeon]